ncbi:MAG: HAD family hydrolase [Bacteroidetes bacterium]|nr:HAD family hydrolase [Bacteroidota bacterium]
MIKYQQYKHISFDLWLTLIKSNPSFKAERNKAFKEIFQPQAPPNLIDTCIRKYDLLANAMSEKTGKHLNAAHIWALILNELGMDLQKMDESRWEHFNAETERLFFKYPPVLIDIQTPELFKQLTEEGISLNILSNTAFIPGKLLRPLLVYLNIGQYLHFQLYSDETGYSKPSSEMFKLLIQQAGSIRSLQRNEILHIGDNPYADKWGAENAGISAYLFDSKSELLSSRFT